MFLVLLSSVVVWFCMLSCCVFVLCVPSSPALPAWGSLPVGCPRQSANQAWCGESFIDTSLLHAPSLWLHALLFSALAFSPFFCLVWSPTGTVLQTVYLWRHRSHFWLKWFQDCSPPCTPLNLCFNKYLFHSLQLGSFLLTLTKSCISFGNQGPRVWRNTGEAQNPSCLKSSVKFPKSVMIWGVVTSADVGLLCFIKSKVNAAVYPEILEHFILFYSLLSVPALAWSFVVINRKVYSAEFK